MFKDALELDDIDNEIEGIGITENGIEITSRKIDKNDIPDVPIENSIERQLKEVTPILNETNLADVILEKERLKSEAISAFLSNGTQKTEVTPSERKIIPLLRQLAINPFPDIACHIQDTEKRNEIENMFRMPILEEWVEQYITLGIPVGRKGRKEEVEVLKSYLDDDIDLKATGGNFK